MDEDDAFLYGSDPKKDEESDDIEVKDTDNVEQVEEPKAEKPEQASTEETKATEEAEDDDDEYSTDSDVEFVIGSLETKPSTAEGESVVQKEGETGAGGAAEGNDGNKPQTVRVLTETKGLNIDEVGKYNDIPVNELTLDELKDKPWRLPGADISDYFNFGFDELSWLAYCKKQNTLRKDFNPAKVIAELMGGAMPPGMGAPGANGSAPPPFMMPPMGMPPFMGGMPQIGGNNMPGGNTGMPPMAKLPTRPLSKSRSPEPVQSRMSSVPPGPGHRDRNDNYRDRSEKPAYRDRDRDKGGYRDRDRDKGGYRDRADKSMEMRGHASRSYRDRGYRRR